MTPIEVRDALEALGAIDDADRSGVYALRVAVPDGVESVQRACHDENQRPLPDDMADQLAAAQTVVYVGKTGRAIRTRLMEHAEANVRKASLLNIFDIAGVYNVYPGAHTHVAERDRARQLSDATTCVWTDGELF